MSCIYYLRRGKVNCSTPPPSKKASQSKSKLHTVVQPRLGPIRFLHDNTRACACACQTREQAPLQIFKNVVCLLHEKLHSFKQHTHTHARTHTHTHARTHARTQKHTAQRKNRGFRSQTRLTVHRHVQYSGTNADRRRTCTGVVGWPAGRARWASLKNWSTTNSSTSSCPSWSSGKSRGVSTCGTASIEARSRQTSDTWYHTFSSCV